jgi:hypothetical protein
VKTVGTNDCSESMNHTQLGANGSDAEAPVTSLARRATGPRTQQGKEKSKGNATRFGIFSKAVVLKTESQAEVNDLQNGLTDYFQPNGAMEEILVDKLAAYLWRQRRLILAEVDAGGRLTENILQLNDGAPKLDVLLRYEAPLDRGIDRILTQLERFQRIRLGQLVPSPIKLEISSE